MKKFIVKHVTLLCLCLTSVVCAMTPNQEAFQIAIVSIDDKYNDGYPNVWGDLAANEIALHAAVILGNDHRVRELLNTGAPINVNATDKNGFTPLHFAVPLERSNSTKMLLAAGANINATNKYGYTPAQLVFKHSFTLIAYQVSINLLEAICGDVNMDVNMRAGYSDLALTLSTIAKCPHFHNGIKRTLCKSILAVHHPRCGAHSLMNQLPQSVVQEICMRIKPGPCVYTPEEFDQIAASEKELQNKQSSRCTIS